MTGLSIVVLSYDRPAALRSLLASLGAQDTAGLDLELLLCNNSTRASLGRSRFSATGRLLRALPDVKIVNSSYNWLCRIRYSLATLARHDLVLFLDDDLTLVHPGLLRRMVDVKQTLGPSDILSCWTALWTRWDDETLTKVRMGFLYPETTELTECDYIGPGICIFDRRILFHPALQNLPPEFHRSDSTWFPWLTAMEVGSRKYYLPSFEMIRVHPQFRRHALEFVRGFRAEQYAAYKRMWKRGYTPVLATDRHQGRADTPEARAARSLRPEVDAW